MMRAAMRVMRHPLAEDRRASLPIQIVARWALLAVAFLEVNIDPGTSGATYIALNLFAAGAAVANLALTWMLHTGRPIRTGWVGLAGVYDVLAITAAIATVDQFDNINFIFYSPAFVAFTLVFPGWPSVAYMAATT